MSVARNLGRTNRLLSDFKKYFYEKTDKTESVRRKWQEHLASEKLRIEKTTGQKVDFRASDCYLFDKYESIFVASLHESQRVHGDCSPEHAGPIDTRMNINNHIFAEFNKSEEGKEKNE